MSVRRLIKNCLSLFSAIIFYNRRSKVIYLHDVHRDECYAIDDCSIHINKFVNIVNAINGAGFEVVNEITKPRNQIRICFDDGYRGIWDCRYDLIRIGVFPTIFIATSLIGQSGYLTASQLKELSSLGFSIQSHAVSHRPLTEFTHTDLIDELVNSQLTLKYIVDKDVDEICLPLGYYSDEVLNEATKLYSRVFLSTPGAYYDRIEIGIVNRILCQDLSSFSLKLALIGGQDIFYNRIQHLHKK